MQLVCPLKRDAFEASRICDGMMEVSIIMALDPNGRSEHACSDAPLTPRLQYQFDIGNWLCHSD